MIGSFLVSAGIGLLQGLGTRKQGERIKNAGEHITNEYAKLNANKVLFENSFEEHKKTIGKIKGYQEETAKLQYNKNKTAIKEALGSNLRNVMNQYTTSKEALNEQVKDMKSKIIISTPNINIEEASIRNDSLSLLGNEAVTNERTLNENMINSVKAVSEEGIEQEYRIGTDYDNTMSNIRKAYNQSLGNAELQKIQDISRINEIVESGRISGNNLVQQGYGIIAQSEANVANSFLNAGLGIFNRLGGFDFVDNKINSLFGTKGQAWDQMDKIKNVFSGTNNNFLGGIGNGLFR